MFDPLEPDVPSQDHTFSAGELAIAQFHRQVHTYAAICIEKLLRVKDKTPQALEDGHTPIFTGVNHPIAGNH